MSDATVALGGLEMEIQGFPPAVSIEGPELHSISDFIGESQSERLPDGRLMFKVTGKPLQGTSNEPNVLKVLAGSLAQADYRPATDEQNRRGIDGWVRDSDGAPVPVQVVKVPAESEFGAAVAKGDWEITVTVDEAASWIKAAIDHKTTGPTPSIAPADRASMILALDVRHAGLLICDDVVAALVGQMPDVAQLGFRAIWLVGSTTAGTRKL
jgi:hypothetical protein